MVFKELSKEEFDTFTSNYIPSTPYQTSYYGDTMVSQGFTAYYLGMVDNSTIKAATMVMVKTDAKFKYGYCPRGYLIDYKDAELLNAFSINIRKFLNSKGVIAIKINPTIVKNIYDSKYNLIASNPDYDEIFRNLKDANYNHLGYNAFFEAVRPRFEAIIELNHDYFVSFDKMRKEFKTKVRAAENSGVRIHKGTFENLKTLYEQAKGKYPRNFKYYEDLYNNFSKNDMIEIYYAKVDFDTYLKKNQAEFVEIEKRSELVNNEVIKNRGKSHQKLLNKKIAADKALNIARAKLNNAINLMSKYPDGLIISSLIVIKTSNTITLMIDAHDKNYTSFNAKHLMIWKLIEKYSKEGYRFFNLGGITWKVDSNNKYYGLNNYKLGFGSNVYEYIGDLEFITNKPLYLMYRNTGSLFKK